MRGESGGVVVGWHPPYAWLRVIRRGGVGWVKPTPLARETPAPLLPHHPLQLIDQRQRLVREAGMKPE